jgi:hypothetical protein
VEKRVEYVGKKHPVSKQEIQTWLTKYHFRIENMFGDRLGSQYNAQSVRIIFWAKRM